MVFMMLSEWHGSRRARRRRARPLAARPRVARGCGAQWDALRRAVPGAGSADRRFIEVTKPELEPWLGRTLADLAAARGGHPSMCSPTGSSRTTSAPASSSSVSATATSTPSPSCSSIPTPSSRRAMPAPTVQMMCAAGDATLLLARHVRDRGDLTVEQAVHELTGKHADAFGFHDRGVEPGKVADLTVFALAAPLGRRRVRGRPPRRRPACAGPGRLPLHARQARSPQEEGVPSPTPVPAGIFHSATHSAELEGFKRLAARFEVRLITRHIHVDCEGAPALSPT